MDADEDTDDDVIGAAQRVGHSNHLNSNDANLKMENEENIIDVCMLLEHDQSEFNLKDFTTISDLPVSTNFVGIKQRDGKIIYVKKSALCWLFSKSQDRVSTHWLRKFVALNEGIISKTGSHGKSNENIPQELIYIGDWIIFQYENEKLVCQVIGFSYLIGTKRERQYTLRSAPVKPPTSNFRKKGIGILGNIFRLDFLGGNLDLFTFQNHSLIDIENYISHITKPECRGGQLVLDAVVQEMIK